MTTIQALKYAIKDITEIDTFKYTDNEVLRVCNSLLTEYDKQRVLKLAYHHYLNCYKDIKEV